MVDLVKSVVTGGNTRILFKIITCDRKVALRGYCFRHLTEGDNSWLSESCFSFSAVMKSWCLLYKTLWLYLIRCKYACSSDFPGPCFSTLTDYVVTRHMCINYVQCALSSWFKLCVHTLFTVNLLCKWMQLQSSEWMVGSTTDSANYNVER